ncbi:MAG: hypothetical protein M1839_007052 [Geoglossum umbratile]|nr:MAG: hypothetical protein M1839_007052 [Geoglossum umbratile]
MAKNPVKSATAQSSNSTLLPVFATPVNLTLQLQIYRRASGQTRIDIVFQASSSAAPEIQNLKSCLLLYQVHLNMPGIAPARRIYLSWCQRMLAGVPPIPAFKTRAPSPDLRIPPESVYRIPSGEETTAKERNMPANLPLHQHKINGDATDQAILRFSEGPGSASALRSAWKKVFEIAFNSKNKYMLRIMAPVSVESLRGTLIAEEQKEYGQGDLSVQLIP